MKELVEYIVKSIVNTPDAVIVGESVDQDGSVNLTLTVDVSDMGLVIGKSGQTIKAIRKLLITRAMADNKRVSLFLKEPEGSERPVRAEKVAEADESSAQEEEISESEETESPEESEEIANVEPENIETEEAEEPQDIEAKS